MFYSAKHSEFLLSVPLPSPCRFLTLKDKGSKRERVGQIGQNKGYTDLGEWVGISRVDIHYWPGVGMVIKREEVEPVTWP